MSYSQLSAHFSRIGQLEEAAAILEWDQAVNMPAAAGPQRARAMAGLSAVTHEMVSDPHIADWLEAARGDDGLDDWQRVNVNLMERLFRRATALPKDLVFELAEASKVSEQAWRRFRAENDFKSYLPFLERVLAATRTASEVLGAALDLSPYEALMDEYEPGLRASYVDEAFQELRRFLPSIREEVLERQAREQGIALEGPFSIDAQKKLGGEMMRACGLDMARVRLDVSHHPFCGGVPSDVRITTRYEEHEFLSALMGVLHESGHAKYEQNLPEEWQHQPIGKARGMISHESQSLLQEMQVCRGQAFLSFLVPHLSKVFPDQFKGQPKAFSETNLRRLVTRVQPDLIRVNADEVTYPSHILLRYELERDLVSGSLRAADLPDAWDQKMQEHLGLRTLGNDRDGCLQDVHWPAGAFGYFPLYTLGAMVAAQLFAAARERLPDLEDELRRGDFSAINAFLREAVWSRGSHDDIESLVTRATGKGLDPGVFERHLRERYLD